MKRLITSVGQQPGGSILVLYCYPPNMQMRPAIASHLHVLTNSDAAHQTLYLNVQQGVPGFVKNLHFDAIILHTTLLCARWACFFDEIAAQIAWLRHSDAVKIALPQDEYDHAAVLDEWLESLGVQVIGSNFGEDVRALLYPRMHKQARFMKCLTGYIDPAPVAEFAGKMVQIKDRPLDIVYRAAHLPFWFGSQGQLKHRLADIVARRADELGLRTDISTDPARTITSNHWFHFLGSSKTVVGCESGSSVLDPRGLIQKRIRELQAEMPKLAFEDVHRYLPADWDSQRFFAIGPRHLEAIITRTCQVLVEGAYDGILLPHRHYLPLRRDFANLDEVLAMTQDSALLEATTQRAYEDILESGKVSYASFARQLGEQFPRALHPRSNFSWRGICGLVAVNVGVRCRIAAGLGFLTRRWNGCVGLLKSAVKTGLRCLGLLTPRSHARTGNALFRDAPASRAEGPEAD